MDALAALGVFAQTPSKDCRRGLAAAAVADDLPDNTTPQSRSGGRGRGRMSRGTAKVESDDDSGAGAAGSPGLQEVKNGEGDNACKACYGCGREPGSPDWFVPGEALKWAAMGKGHYCKDCHTLWRTLYASSLNLVHFGVWLKEATNQTTFNLEVIAYCSLVFEGVDCIRAARILERCNMIKFVFKLLGVPTGPFVVAEIWPRRPLRAWPVGPAIDRHNVVAQRLSAGRLGRLGQLPQQRRPGELDPLPHLSTVCPRGAHDRPKPQVLAHDFHRRHREVELSFPS